MSFAEEWSSCYKKVMRSEDKQALARFLELDQIIERLSYRQRMIIRLHCLEGRPYRGIARVLRMPEYEVIDLARKGLRSVERYYAVLENTRKKPETHARADMRANR